VRRLQRLPIRWRLAVTSASLTFLILAAFAIVIGLFTARQVREDFDDELSATVADLQTRIGVRELPDGVHLTVRPDVIQAAAAGDAELRIVTPQGHTLFRTKGADDLGSALVPIQDKGHWRVASRPIRAPDENDPAAYVQYAKPHDSVNATIARINLFLGAGVLGGALLALLAGLAVARRAMAPVSSLTSAAREIARTRDPAVTLPKPESDDEVSELAHTLDDMLQQLNAARLELEALLDRQRDFVADASHEMRTPLTSILANLELLENALQGEDHEVVKSALRSSRRMRGLVADLLLLARADARRERPREPVDVGDVVRAAVGEAAALAADHDLSVSAARGVVVEGWPDDLHRLVLNLIENALQHTPPGTAVHVRVDREDDEAVILVEDEGPGLPPGIREQAFERFVRGGGDSARGSGLGLSIVDAVAESHGGSVTYQDRQGGGARFVVRLPYSLLPAPSPSTEANQTSTTTGSTIGRRLSRS
jgi:signal transduction histidine kinase